MNLEERVSMIKMRIDNFFMTELFSLFRSLKAVGHNKL